MVSAVCQFIKEIIAHAQIFVDVQEMCANGTYILDTPRVCRLHALNYVLFSIISLAPGDDCSRYKSNSHLPSNSTSITSVFLPTTQYHVASAHSSSTAS